MPKQSPSASANTHSDPMGFPCVIMGSGAPRLSSLQNGAHPLDIPRYGKESNEWLLRRGQEERSAPDREATAESVSLLTFP